MQGEDNIDEKNEIGLVFTCIKSKECYCDIKIIEDLNECHLKVMRDLLEEYLDKVTDLSYRKY